MNPQSVFQCLNCSKVFPNLRGASECCSQKDLDLNFDDGKIVLMKDVTFRYNTKEGKGNLTLLIPREIVVKLNISSSNSPASPNKRFDVIIMRVK